MPLRRLPASFLLLLALQIPLSQASPIRPPPSTLDELALLLPPPSAPLSLDFGGSLVRKAEEHDVPLSYPSKTSAYVALAEASAAPTEMVSPFVSSENTGSGAAGDEANRQGDGYSSSKPLAPAIIGVIAGLVVLLFGLALWALYRSQRRKNQSRRDLIESERERAAARASNASVRSGGSGGSHGERKERAGSYSSQGTMVDAEGGGVLGKKISPTPVLQ